MQQNWPATGFIALCAVVATATWIPNSQSTRPPTPGSGEARAIRTSLTTLLDAEGGVIPWRIQVRYAAELDRVFSALDYSWPTDDQNAVPAVEVTALPLDLDDQETGSKKAIFFRTLLPLVLLERNRIQRQRQAVLAWIESGQPPTPAVEDIAKLYRVKGNLAKPASRATLLKRVDTIPIGLALAQAANESGWGTSRFAVNANNLFGVWTFKRYAGLAPKGADSDAKHAVRAYPSLRRAVRSYFFNINVGHAYQELRNLRAQMRQGGQPLDAIELAAGLINYSSRGEEYVDEIRLIIRTNKLNSLGRLTIAQIDTPPTR